MEYNVIPQITYTDITLTDNTPVKASVINEARTNIQNTLTYLDMHQGSQRVDTHGLVSRTQDGFAPSSIYGMIDSLIDQLDELEELVSHDPFPPGAIAIWNGEYEDIPKDWVACQGAQQSPDMRNRFPVGVSKDRPYRSIGGSMSIDVNLANMLKTHSHTFQNAMTPFATVGPFNWFTKYGKITTAHHLGCYDWDNYPCVLKETVGATGGSASTGTKTAKFMPAHITKWYIMRLENNVDVTKLKNCNITINQPANGTIKTNYVGKVKAGTTLIITVVPKNENYIVEKVYVNNVEVPNNSVRYVNEDIVISAKVTYIYAEKFWSTPGTYEFTVPQDITRLRVAAVGGGGGCSITCEDDNDNHNYKATPGTASSFGGTLITATGGDAGTAIIGSRGTTAHGTAGAGGMPSGNAGTVCNVNYYAGQGTVFTSVGGDGFARSFTKKSGSYGEGGAAKTNINGADDALSNAAGGSGGFNSGYVNVTPGKTYTVVVGSAGANRVAYWEGNSYEFYAPKAGYVLIAYGGDI